MFTYYSSLTRTPTKGYREISPPSPLPKPILTIRLLLYALKIKQVIIKRNVIIKCQHRGWSRCHS